MSKQTLRVGMIGYAFMGAAHSQGWRNAPRFFDLPSRIELTAVAGRNADAVAAAADQYGFAGTETDWRALLERDDIDLIDICTPGNLHAEIAIAALRAGKHVLCEKPLANTVEEAEQMAAAAREAVAGGVYAMCGFTYRRTPALAYAKQLIDDGRLGTIRHVRGQYLQDWLHDADAPMTWRLDKSTSGFGCPRRHRGAPDRHHPVADRPVDQRRVRPAGDVRDVTTAGRRAVRAGRPRRHLRGCPAG